MKKMVLSVMALPEGNKTILASEYQLYLPDTGQLAKEVDEAKQLVMQSKSDNLRP